MQQIKKLSVVLPALIFVLMSWNIEVAAEGMDYRECVKYAIEYSPYLKKSGIEIDVRRLDETDAKWSFVPYLFLRSSYALNKYQSERNENLRDWSISFSTGNYNPLQSYFTLKTREYLTEIAMAVHLNAISEGLHRLAQGFIQMEAVRDQEDFIEKEKSLAKENLKFVKKRHSLDAASALDVQVAAQKVTAIEAKAERLAARKISIAQDFKDFLGLEGPRKLMLDFENARRQVLGEFDPSSANLEQVKANSKMLEVQQLKEKLQDWRITLAYTDYIPKISFGVRTPDVAQSELQGKDYYFSLDASMPLWQGFNRPRNVKRQKKILKQFEADTELEESKIAAEWRNALQERTEAQIDLKLARSAEELALLKLKAARIGYKSNKRSYGDLLESKIDYIRARERTHQKSAELDLAVLNIRYISGDLFKSHVNVEPWKEK